MILLIMVMVYVLGFGSRAVFVQCQTNRMCKRLLKFYEGKNDGYFK